VIAALAALGTPGAARAAEGLNLIPSVPLLFANLTVFALLIYPVHRLLIGPLVRVLDERERRTTGALESAAQVGRDSAQQRAELEVRLARGRAEAQERRARILAETKAEEQRRLDAARQEAASELSSLRAVIEGELEQARQSLRADARALADEAAARILGRPL
jgi:F-type H+-transporting ATPase subunit b